MGIFRGRSVVGRPVRWRGRLTFTLDRPWGSPLTLYSVRLLLLTSQPPRKMCHVPVPIRSPAPAPLLSRLCSYRCPVLALRIAAMGLRIVSVLLMVSRSRVLAHHLGIPGNDDGASRPDSCPIMYTYINHIRHGPDMLHGNAVLIMLMEIKRRISYVGMTRPS